MSEQQDIKYLDQDGLKVYTSLIKQNMASKAEVGGKANKATSETITLASTGWTGDSAPYTYNLNVANTYDCELLLPNDATAEEVQTIMSACLSGNGTDNILRAWGTKPESDIRLVLLKILK